MSASDSRPATSATASAGAPEGQDTGASGSAVQGTAERLEELARVIDSAVFDVCTTWRPAFARRAAEAVLSAGYRRVVEDEDTVERVAEVLWRRYRYWREVPGYDITKDSWRGPARAALQALREER